MVKGRVLLCCRIKSRTVQIFFGFQKFYIPDSQFFSGAQEPTYLPLSSIEPFKTSISPIITFRSSHGGNWREEDDPQNSPLFSLSTDQSQRIIP